MNSHDLLFRGSLAFLLTCMPSVASAALCAGDAWGIKSAHIEKLSEAAVRMRARTQLVHGLFPHDGCTKMANAKAVLIKVQGSAPPGVCQVSKLDNTVSHDLYTPYKECIYLGPGDFKTEGQHFAGSEEGLPRTQSNLVHLAGPTPTPPPQAGICSDVAEYYCQIQSGAWTYNWDICMCEKAYSPLVVDTLRNGYRFSSAEGGVLFDLDGDGNPEQTSWPAEGSDEAFVAMDRNGDGVIQGGTELLGNATVVDSDGTTVDNGFEALRALEADPALGNGDGIVNASDGLYARLTLWTDTNRDGVSSADEMVSLASAGVLAIETDYKSDRHRDPNGNLLAQRAKVWWQTSHRARLPGFVYDVWLVTVP